MSKIQSDFPNHSDIEKEYNYFQGMATQSGQSSRVSEYYTLELKIVIAGLRARHNFRLLGTWGLFRSIGWLYD